MVTIKWNKKASRLFREHIIYAQIEFGQETALRWYRQINKIEDRLHIWDMRMNPENLKRRIK